MNTSLSNARTYRDLLETDDAGPYQFSRIFGDEGWRSRARCKKKFKLLKRIEPALTPMLQEGERVFFLTQGVTSLSLIEWWCFGLVLYYMNRRAIVLTTERILLLQINSRSRPRELRSQIAWAAVAKLRSTLLGNMIVEFRNRKRLLLTGVPRADRKWLKTVMNQVIAKLQSRSDLLTLEHLCPHCYQPMTLGPASCPRCDGPLKSAKKATVLSLILPGTGDLYLGHKGFAALELLVSVPIWLLVISTAVDPVVSVAEVAMGAAMLILIFHGLDALTTRHIALKGAYPASNSSDRWRFVTAGALPTIALVALALSAGSKLDVTPEATAVPGSEVSQNHVAALLSADLIQPEETVRFFYSHSPVSILDDGSLFTDDRIVSYAQGGDSKEYYTSAFTDVVDLGLEYSPQLGEPHVIYVVPERGQAYVLFASADEQGASFAEALFDQWRTVRTDLASGIWFDGGMGSSFDDAIVVRGVSSADSIDTAERWWLTLWFGEEDVGWRISDRARYELAGRTIDDLTVEGLSGEASHLVFDVGAAEAER